MPLGASVSSLIGGPQNITVPPGGGKIIAMGTAEYVATTGSGNSNIRLQVDGVTIGPPAAWTASPTASGTAGDQVVVSIHGESGLLAAGVHTVDLQGFAVGGGISSDQAQLVAFVIGS